MVDQGRIVRCERCAAEWKVWGPGLRFCRRCGLMLGAGEQRDRPPLPGRRPQDWWGAAILLVIVVVIFVLVGDKA